MRSPLRLLPLYSLLVACLLLSACASNTVRLLYSPTEAGTLPPPSAKQVVVVMFDDKRPNQAIGVRGNGTSFAANSSIADWASRSLGDAIYKHGLQVSYATTLAEAKRAHNSYIITGVVREMWLHETGATSATATIRLSLSLSDGKNVLYSETLSSTQERKGILTTGDVENLLLDTLREIVSPAARKISEAVN